MSQPVSFVSGLEATPQYFIYHPDGSVSLNLELKPLAVNAGMTAASLAFEAGAAPNAEPAMDEESERDDGDKAETQEEEEGKEGTAIGLGLNELDSKDNREQWQDISRASKKNKHSWPSTNQ